MALEAVALEAVGSEAVGSEAVEGSADNDIYAMDELQTNGIRRI